ncbi:hypothetical protein PGTUg99_036889 [Puccinia graminis f. sp. tritici]|uniref:Uncharacterized protein n=2 Tax=Puccinia graminis f. sp. tritici TaxID=56615 RepID=E3JUU0_PUCGT|nr:uncharacterized protein PGTG_01146 [Puccinia graminis f. sp. tritici CRL 75-36-700-3]EFP75815.2 hypothetical protein PGTG_01146 [Puccinia graminis f. sp. tritici CRL 75-36-700-3]KAA1102870.1 hypothetical protein PGTUg99_036889 [Puccinia graminis f. sp. tritici]
MHFYTFVIALWATCGFAAAFDKTKQFQCPPTGKSYGFCGFPVATHPENKLTYWSLAQITPPDNNTPNIFNRCGWPSTANLCGDSAMVAYVFSKLGSSDGIPEDDNWSPHIFLESHVPSQG